MGKKKNQQGQGQITFGLDGQTVMPKIVTDPQEGLPKTPSFLERLGLSKRQESTPGVAVGDYATANRDRAEENAEGFTGGTEKKP